MAKQYGIYQPIDYSKVNTDQLDPSLVAAVKKNTMVDGKPYAVPHVYGTASRDAGKFLNANIAANFKRGLPPEALANTNWYPTVPPGLEEMEGKVMDKIKAAK